MSKEAMKLAEDALKRVRTQDMELVQLSMIALAAIREAQAEQPAPPPECQTEAEKTAFAFGWFKALETVREQPAQQEPVAWVYSEGLEALKNGKPWTAYGTKQEANNIALYLHPTPECEPYAWVTFTPYGDEDDVWYENPEGQLLEGWTYKPLYDTAAPRREWVGLTDDEILYCVELENPKAIAEEVEAKLKEKNT